MFIVWGTKKVETNLGYVADFCPICRDIHAFRITRIGKAGHVYGLQLGASELVGHNRQCMTCRTLFGADPNDYGTPEKRRGKMSMEELIASTFPNIRTRYARRLEIEACAATSPEKLGAEIRRDLILEPFQLLNHAVHRRFSTLHVDFTMVAAMLLGFLIVPLFISNYLSYKFHLIDKNEGSLILASIIAAFIATFPLGRRAGKIFMRKKIYPVIANTLQPLHPTQGEIAAVISQLKASGTMMGKRANVEEFMHATITSHAVVSELNPVHG
ncbi:MAG: hypothetical protein JO002_07300 [Burkholderiaceae bacterium]|nr:hypothetical protein [Burkholderiaceae bacterium]